MADFGCMLNHVTLSISSYLQKMCFKNLDLWGWGPAAPPFCCAAGVVKQNT